MLESCLQWQHRSFSRYRMTVGGCRPPVCVVMGGGARARGRARGVVVASFEDHESSSSSSESSGGCCYCQESTVDVLNLGEVYAYKDLLLHYFCLLISTFLVQSGQDEDGVLGFLYEDILRDLNRCKRNKCYYCGLRCANIKCCHPGCLVVFHLPCGLRNDSQTLFFDNHQSFCRNHRFNQTIPIEIYESRPALRWPRVVLKKIDIKNIPMFSRRRKQLDTPIPKFQSSFTCCICTEQVTPFPSAKTFWPPCCRKDEWFHRSCVARLALSAGRHFVKCPLCNNQKEFLDALLKFGFHIPDRDASWELENGAFADLLFRPKTCYISDCLCPQGNKYSNKKWRITVCSTCGSQAAHNLCAKNNFYENELTCDHCVIEDNRSDGSVISNNEEIPIIEIEDSEDEQPDMQVSIKVEKPEITTYEELESSEDWNRPLVSMQIKNNFEENKLETSLFDDGIKLLISRKRSRRTKNNFEKTEPIRRSPRNIKKEARSPSPPKPSVFKNIDTNIDDQLESIMPSKRIKLELLDSVDKKRNNKKKRKKQQKRKKRKTPSSSDSENKPRKRSRRPKNPFKETEPVRRRSSRNRKLPSRWSSPEPRYPSPEPRSPSPEARFPSPEHSVFKNESETPSKRIKLEPDASPLVKWLGRDTIINEKPKKRKRKKPTTPSPSSNPITNYFDKDENVDHLSFIKITNIQSHCQKYYIQTFLKDSVTIMR